MSFDILYLSNKDVLLEQTKPEVLKSQTSKNERADPFNRQRYY